jgi:hypothetical protein
VSYYKLAFKPFLPVYLRVAPVLLAVLYTCFILAPPPLSVGNSGFL